MKTDSKYTSDSDVQNGGRYEIRTDWRDSNGDALTGSDERVIESCDTLADALAKASNTVPSHPHNNVSVWDTLKKESVDLTDR
jgi:hypothetical protein